MSESDLLLEVIDPYLPPHQRAKLQGKFRHIIENIPDEKKEGFLEAYQKAGSQWGFNPRHPLATALMTYLSTTLIPKVPVEGIEYCHQALAAVKKGIPVVMIGNHLSYGDVNYLHALLGIQGLPDFPLMVMAGPKVYQDPFRLLSSMAFDSLKMAQPPSRASEGADVSKRELVDITRTVIEDAQAWQKKGRILYFFPEGSRSREGVLNRFVSASARYTEPAETLIIPVGFVGTEGLVGVENNDIRHSENIRVRVGPPKNIRSIETHLPTNPGQRRTRWMDYLGFAIADLLPKKMRGAYPLEGSLGCDLEGVRELYLTDHKNPLD